MSVWTKFKFTAMSPSSGLVKQFYSTSKLPDGTIKSGATNQQSTEGTPNPTSKFKPQYHLMDALDKNSYSSQVNARYVESMFSRWIKDINSVDKVNINRRFDRLPMNFTKTNNSALFCIVSVKFSGK